VESNDLIEKVPPTTRIPASGINPGETKYFGISINKFEFDPYEFQEEIITEKFIGD